MGGPSGKAEDNMKAETYVSVVVETDGPIPGPYSLRGIGAEALNRDGSSISSFETFLHRLPKATMHPDNQRYWARQQNLEMYHRMEELSQEPIDAITHLTAWISNLPSQPVMVAYNAAYTWMWIHWYCTQYSTRSPFAMGPLDLKSQMAPFISDEFLTLSKRDLPDSWRKELPGNDSVSKKADKQAYIFKSLINAKRQLSNDEIDLPTWTRARFGPSVRESKRAGRARKNARMAKTP